MRTLLPGVRHVGVIYDPTHTTALAEQCEAALHTAGMTLNRRAVASGDQVTAALQSLASHVEILWLLPDPTVVSPETTRTLLQAAREARLPVLAYSEALARAGALLAVEGRYDDMGAKAAAMAKQILAGRAAPGVGSPEGALFLNARVADQIGVRIPAAARAEAAKVFE